MPERATHRITICKDTDGVVRYSVQDEAGREVVPPTVLERGGPATFAHRDDDLDVVLIPARGGVGGRVITTGRQPLAPQSWEGVKTYPKAAPLDVMRREVAARYGSLDIPAAHVAAVARQTMHAVNARLQNLPPGSKVAVKHNGDGGLSWLEFAPGEPAVVPDTSWTAFGRPSEETQPGAREPWQRVAEDDMGLLVTRPTAYQVQFRDVETKRVEADWWPSKGTLHVYAYREKGQRPDVLGSTGVRDGMEVIRALKQA